jgi:hypothetical protein
MSPQARSLELTFSYGRWTSFMPQALMWQTNIGQALSAVCLPEQRAFLPTGLLWTLEGGSWWGVRGLQHHAACRRYVLTNLCPRCCYTQEIIESTAYAYVALDSSIFLYRFADCSVSLMSGTSSHVCIFIYLFVVCFCLALFCALFLCLFVLEPNYKTPNPRKQSSNNKMYALFP